MASSPSSLQVLDQFQISPPPGSVPDTSLPLTFFDIVWLFTGPVERVFFYPFPHPTSHFVTHLLPTLKSSLSLTLQHFYPLAGRVRSSPDPSSDSKFEICYSAGDSITLISAECSDDFDQLSGNHPRNFRELYKLIPQLPHSNDGTIPLLALQVTLFPDHGISIGVAIHHVACDDSSSMHFIKSWAASCRLGGSDSPPPPPPLHDRSTIADPDGLYSKILAEIEGLRAGGPPPPATEDSPSVGVEQPGVVIASFSLTREQIERLKQLVLEKSKKGEASPIHCSAFVVACAFAWKCLVKAQGGYASAGKKTAHLLFSVECRSRLRPAVPAEYFGNCLRPCFVELPMGDLVKDDGVLFAAEAIGRAIKGLEDGVLKGAEGWFQKIVSLIPEQPMSVAGSPKYGVYDTDFGWGRPKKVEVASIEKTPGTISLAESREEQGGIEIGLVLPKHEMDEFSSCFSSGSKLL
ncbi:phenolic glucoside malonyltransferase 2 [Elaeis guineensis]|uniref:Phenolic glucoside malonyltransferase 1 n=1 Tax=Elaeis guineensis var. tenera TaxID=51953 RepID=A0A6I9SBR2_ELAGV|nr:phenolic glucoside malonyltransferase 1 [Elaeis guineensis]